MKMLMVMSRKKPILTAEELQEKLNKKWERRRRSAKHPLVIAMDAEAKHKKMLEEIGDVYLRRSRSMAIVKKWKRCEK